MAVVVAPWPRSHSLPTRDCSTPAASLGRCLQQLGATCMQPAQSRGGAQRDSAATAGRPDLLLVRTHAGGFSSRSPGATSSARSSANGVAASASTSSRRRSDTLEHRHFATAPAAPQIPASVVEEATGVRLSDTQLQVLRRRYQDRALGSGISGGGRSGGACLEPSSGELRREVFSSVVLRPGQFPKCRVSSESGHGRPELPASPQRTSTATIGGARSSRCSPWAVGAGGRGGSAVLQTGRRGRVPA
uniref:Uncharacterized protein n=1 Tax=Pyrodinium bahamense TaxID=73915 RepID=A0A7S0FWX3_9DINO|mmetsp:Transcript_6718/g.18464  ORF Transcript_6718/g.18464 Transcript_6718/m.18464 type:complete len:247 (+) Transcript_6718:55-795(+)